MINIDRINLEEFFGCVNATNTKEMKSNAFKTIRTWLQEKSFAKWSDGQLEYVGDFKDGVDFVSEDNINYEICLLYTSPSPRDYAASRMPSSA